jgi:hypothetical protein
MDIGRITMPSENRWKASLYVSASSEVNAAAIDSTLRVAYAGVLRGLKRGDLLHDRDGALADERDAHGMGARAVACGQRAAGKAVKTNAVGRRRPS